MSYPVFISVTVLAIIGFFSLSIFSYVRRRKFFSAPFPGAWEKILRRNVPLYSKLPKRFHPQYHRRIKEFLSKKTFEACGGLTTVSDEIAVTIAGNAAFLVINRNGPAWTTLQSVLIYPDSFSAPGLDEDEQENGLITRDDTPRDGESWTYGSVVFSKKRILRDIALHGNGQNVILHEFAHQIDSDDGIAGGRPAFSAHATTLAWQERAEIEIARLRSGDPTSVIDEYGAENPAEFFATSVEAFFENSVAMRRAHPELYALLTELFGLSPADWQ